MAARMKAQAAQVWERVKAAEGTDRWFPLFTEWSRLYALYLKAAADAARPIPEVYAGVYCK